jgi:hypothetical protein
MMTRGDFPFPFQPSSDFPSRGEICRYVEAFAAKFELNRFIHFHTTVERVKPCSPGNPGTKWEVTVSSGGVSKTSVFDAVFVATGQFSIPKMPPALSEQNEGYTGSVTHSHNFRDGADFKQKRVLVVGLGNSALDVALECAQRGAASVVVACRRGSILLPIMSDDKKALDKKLVSRFFNAQPSAIRAYRTISEALEVTKEFVKCGMPPPDIGGRSPLHQRISNLKQKQQWLELLRRPDSTLRLHGSGLRSCGPGRTVSFFDGSQLEADAVVACTGYRVDFPFLRDPQGAEGGAAEGAGGLLDVMGEYTIPAEDEAPATAVRALALHRRVMHPRYPTLNFLTQVTCFGNEAIVGGFQARWAVHTLSGQEGGQEGGGALGKGVRRPDMADIQRSCEKLKDRFQRTRPLFPNFVAYTKYVDELAADMGCLPPKVDQLSTWMKEPVLAYHLLFGPHVEAQFRLAGDAAGTPDEQAKATARDLVVGSSGEWSRL